MKIKWLGHACFLITSGKGIRIITDPYMVYETLKYDPVNETADIVTVSHEHRDHSNVKGVNGDPEIIEESGGKTAKDIQFKGVPTYHDDSKGEKRGKNIVVCFTVDGIRLCHLGDLGHMLGAKELTEIGSVDVLFVPVGGNYTIDATVAAGVCNALVPKIAIPMHYKTAKLDFPIAGVEEFLKGKSNVRIMDGNEVELIAGKLPVKTEIIVLKHAR